MLKIVSPDANDLDNAVIQTQEKNTNMNAIYDFVPAHDMNTIANKFRTNNVQFINAIINGRAREGHFNLFYSTSGIEVESDWEIDVKRALMRAGYEVERTYSGDEDGSWGYRISWA